MRGIRRHREDRRRPTQRLLASVAASALAVAGGTVIIAPAQAQDGVERIVVTAQFREQNLQDTPLSITAVSAAELEARSQTNLSQIAAQAPNVTLTEQSAAFGPSMTASIRGIGQYDFNPALEPGVGIYVDDIYLPTLSGAAMELLDLERVEVLRGPQGTLVGRNSIGGAIRLVSRKPEGDRSGYVEATYGSSDRVGVRGGADFALTDNLFARVSAVSKRQDGYVDDLDYGCLFPDSGVPALTPSAGSCKLRELGDVGYDAIRGMLRYEPNDRVDLLVTADFIDDERNSPGDVLLVADNANPNVAAAPGVPLDDRFICGEYCNYSTYISPAIDFAFGGGAIPIAQTYRDATRIFKNGGVSANLSVDLTDTLQLVSITGYRKYNMKFGNDGDYSPANTGAGYNNLNHNFFSQEFRLNGSFGDFAEYTLGAYYSDQKTTYYTVQDLRYAPIPLQFVGDDPVEADSQAVFATVFLHPMENFNVTAGLRYTEESKDYTYSRRNYDGTINTFLDPAGELNGFTGSYSGDQLDYRVSVDYRWSDAIMTYATISTGFKGGGINPRPFNVDQVQPFNPEQLTAYEVGARTDFWDNRARVNVSAFFNDYTDIVLTFQSCPQFGGPGPCALPQNSGDAEVKGLELEAQLEPVDGLQIDASYSLLDFEYTSVNPATGLSDPDTGKPFNSSLITPYTPETKWSFGVQYTADFGDRGSVTPRVDVSYRDKIFTSAANTANSAVDDYTLTNARLTWENPDRDLSIALEVTNVTDEYYLMNIFDLTTAGAGVASGQPGRPREWALTVSKKF